MQEEDGPMNLTDPLDQTGPVKSWMREEDNLEMDPPMPLETTSAPEPPKIPQVFKTLTKEEAEVLERSGGMSRVRLRRMIGYRKVAELLEEMGAVKVCTGDLMFSQQLRLEAIQKCRKAFSKCVSAEETAIVAKALCQLVDSKDETTVKILETVQNGIVPSSEMGLVPKLPPRGVQIISQNTVVNAKQE